MHISNEAKSWIEDNATWLDELNFDDGRDIEKVFKKIPKSLFTEIYQIFKAAGIELLDNNSGNMYGIKSTDGYTTLSLGKHNKTNFNINFTASEGMKGGYQIGFKSISDALNFIENINNTLGVEQALRPSKMQPKIVSQYNWVEVDTIYGKCMITTVAFDRYDPAHAAKNRLVKKANTAILNKEREWIKDNIDIEAIKSYLVSNFKSPRTPDAPPDVQLEMCSDKLCIWFKFIYRTEDQISTLINSLEKLVGIKLDLIWFSKLSTDQYHIFVRPDTPEFNQIKPNIHAKYGI